MRIGWLGSVLHDAHLQVVPMDGWQTRGGPLTSIQGVVCHDTVTGTNWADEDVAGLLVHGRPDLAGPLAQLGLDRQGRFWLVAAGRCNHNGYGTWGNQSIGIEAFNDAKESWPAVQVDAWQRGCAAILRHLGLGADRVKGHKETDPHRKVDPSNLSMNVFRQAVARLIIAPPSQPAPFPIPLEDIVSLGLDDDDDRRAAIRRDCWTFWGMAPSPTEQAGLLATMKKVGSDLALAAITDHPKAVAHRKAG